MTCDTQAASMVLKGFYSTVEGYLLFGYLAIAQVILSLQSSKHRGQSGCWRFTNSSVGSIPTRGFMYVYRLEHPHNGLGPYQTYDHADHLPYRIVRDLKAMASEHSTDKHPAPREEGIKGLRKGSYKCGCRTRQELKEWFFGWITCLKEHGFRIFVYEIGEEWVKVGRKQLVFNHKQAISKRMIR